MQKKHWRKEKAHELGAQTKEIPLVEREDKPARCTNKKKMAKKNTRRKLSEGQQLVLMRTRTAQGEDQPSRRTNKNKQQKNSSTG